MPEAPPHTSAISSRAVSRVFRIGLRRTRQWALESISLDIRTGETMGLVGPNGSGKSTLLRLFAGVDQPTSGSIEVLGGSPDGEAARRCVRFLPDGAPFPRELNAYQALRLIASVGDQGPGTDAAACRRMLDRVGLSPTLRTPLRGFSRGMHRRFGLAQAFLGTPDIVLLDEPTSGLDAPGFPVLADLIQEARARGTTIVLASHIASDLVDHCDRMALLHQARVKLIGTPDELLGEPGARTLTLRGLDAAACEALEARADTLAAELGGAAVDVRPTRRPLVDLYGDIDTKPKTAPESERSQS